MESRDNKAINQKFIFHFLMLHHFSEHLMATQFTVKIEAPESDALRVRAVVEEMFDEIRRLESLLSRFVEDSDVARINRLCRGETIIISQETHRCLTLAQEAMMASNGHFSPAYLSLPQENMENAFTLLSKPSRVRSETESLHIDLGAIGKGFALDLVANIPQSYGYDTFLLCADTSTILAVNPPDHVGWPVMPDGMSEDHVIVLNNNAISCSGKSVRGEHIYHTGHHAFCADRQRVCVLAKSATFADAFSTAAMNMTPDELADLEQNYEVTVIAVS